MARFRETLREHNFICLWVGQIISNFGDRLNQMGLIALIHQKSPGSTYELAKLLLFMILPVFIIGPVAGAYVDRWNRKHILILSDIIRGFLVLSIPIILFSFKNLVLIYVVVFLMFSITRFFLSSKLAIIPSLVSEDKLLIANSLTNVTYMIATVISVGLAGVLIKMVGVVGGFFIDSATFFLSAGLISFLRPVRPTSELSFKDEVRYASKVFEQAIRRSIWSQIKDGMGFILRYPKMRFVMSVLFLLMAGAGAIFCVSIVYIQEVFGTVTSDLGILGVFFGLGLIFGTLFYGRFGHRFNKRYIVYMSFFIGGIAISVLTWVLQRLPYYRIVGILCVLIGASISPIVVSVYTMMHEAIPDKMRGRIFSSQEIVIHLGFLIFMIFTSIIAEYISRVYILISCGLVFAIFGIGGFIREAFSKRDRRRE